MITPAGWDSAAILVAMALSLSPNHVVASLAGVLLKNG
jgi:hypothetical protein